MESNNIPEHRPVPPPLPFSFLRELFTPLSPLRNEKGQYQQPLATSQAFITLDQVRSGLEKNNRTNNSNNHPRLVNVPQLTSHDEELDQLILDHGEQLKRKLAERDRRQEARASKKLREKEESLDRAVRHAGELRLQLEKSRREVSTLSAQSADKNQIILSLHSQLRRAEAAAALASRGGTRRGGEADVNIAVADDAESGCSVHPERRFGACRECGERAAEVVVLPCRHLCLCAECNDNVAPLPCPVCHKIRTGCMQVFMD